MAVACLARGKDDAALILDVLGIDRDTAAWRWNIPRVAIAALRLGRLGREWSASGLRASLPDRAARLIPISVARMTAEGLAVRSGGWEVSASPAARGRVVPRYRLTRAGEALAARIVAEADRGLPLLTRLNSYS
jgi:hypothetical protein